MLDILEKAALEAGRAILSIYATAPEITVKADNSPVTEADQRAEDIILRHLGAAFPEIPVVAEECVAAGIVPDIGGEVFFLVDPLDGTKEFIQQNGDFTVNIALIRQGVPVAGIVYAPAKDVAYTGIDGRAERLEIGPDGTITGRKRIFARLPANPVVAVASRSHHSAEIETYLDEQGITGCRYSGSSLKFCLLAEGDADIYPRFTRTMEWDTAAGDAVLRAAGGVTLGAEGVPLLYGKVADDAEHSFANPHFIAFGRRLTPVPGTGTRKQGN